MAKAMAALQSVVAAMPLALLLLVSPVLAADNSRNGTAFLKGFEWPARTDKESAHAGRRCPVSCAEAGPTPYGWTHFDSWHSMGRCQQPQLFVTSTPDLESRHADYRSCTANGTVTTTDAYGPVCAAGAILRPATADMQMLAWQEAGGAPKATIEEVTTAAKALQANLLVDPSCERTILFAKAGEAGVVGIYVGAEVRKTTVAPLVQKFVDELPALKGTNSRLGAQICGPEGKRGSTHTFGIVADLNGDLPAVHATVSDWAKAVCATDRTVKTLQGVELSLIPATAMTDRVDTVSSTNSTVNPINGTIISRSHSKKLVARAECKATEVFSGNTCDSLAKTCGINIKDFYKYNSPNNDGTNKFCSSLKVGSKVCCSSGTVPESNKPNGDGTCQYVQVADGDSCWSIGDSRCKEKVSTADLEKINANGDSKWCNNLKRGQVVCCGRGKKPDLRPKKNADGSCASYITSANELCFNINDKFYLEEGDLDKFNKKKTWGWQGCKMLRPPQAICLSDGDPPLPVPIDGASCGPQKPGTKRPTDGTKLADVNPCPINACCNIWGNCGLTEDFCIDTTVDDTPGTAKNGTFGCISNCGMEITNNDTPPASFSKVGYFEAWNADRECLNMGVEQAKSDQFGGLTHIHFAFGDITYPGLQIDMSKVKDEWDKFKKMTGVKKILSFGGWAFSNDAATSHIMRECVSPSKRDAFANHVVWFVNENGLDGVDFDWEYPGADDIEGSAPGNAEDGPNYLKFLTTVKARLGSSKSLSIAAPASYWYLRNFPIKGIARVVDYIIYMTYDLHGQWDVNNKWSSPGCDTGNCLRSHVNKTETHAALVMITKAGVPSNKVMVGVTSYGRSFKMADPKCKGPMCKFLGARNQSPAAPGQCTGEGGYIANAEIEEVLGMATMGDNSPIKSAERYFDKSSDSDIVIYNKDEWVAYMSPELKKSRTDWYKGLNFGGTTDWAIDLQYFSGSLSELPAGQDPLPTIEMLPCPDKTYGSLGDLENEAGGMSKECAALKTIDVLRKEFDSAFDGMDEAMKGYDGKFDTYEAYIKETLTERLAAFMKENANKWFTCKMDFGSFPSKDNAKPLDDCQDIIDPKGNTDYFYYYDLKDKQGFEDGLLAEGIDPSWYKLGTMTLSRDPPALCQGCNKYWWRYIDFPVEGDNVEIPDPKEVVTKAKENIGTIKSEFELQQTMIAFEEWEGEWSDVVEALMLPICLVKDSIVSMNEIKAMGEKIEDEKRKQLILFILEIVLSLVGFIPGGALSRLGMAGVRMAKFLRALEDVGDAALVTYQIIENPEMAPVAVLEMITGKKSSKKGYKDIATSKRNLKPGQKDAMGKNYQEINPKVESIMSKSSCSSCRVKRP